MFHRGSLVVALVAALSAPAYGQRGGQQGAGAPGANLQSIDGNIELVGNGIVRVSSKAGQSILVAITQTTKVQYTNKATSDFLRPGLAIEFTAEVDQKHNVKDPVSQVSLVSLNAERPAGLFAEGSSSSESRSAEADNFAFGGGSLKGGDAPPKTKPSPRKAVAVHLPGTCVCRGQIKSLKGGKLVLKISRGTLKADLADNVEVVVDMADLSLARRGDTVSAKGRAGPGLMLFADFISVQGSAPLAGAKKKLPAAKKHSTSKNDDSGDDAGDSKPEKKAAKAAKGADKDD